MISKQRKELILNVINIINLFFPVILVSICQIMSTTENAVLFEVLENKSLYQKYWSYPEQQQQKMVHKPLSYILFLKAKSLSILIIALNTLYLYFRWPKTFFAKGLNLSWFTTHQGTFVC